MTRLAGASEADARYVFIFHDITARWREDEQMREQAFHDPLTHLPNRALLIERLERQIAIVAREERVLAVLFLDLDGFKQVNDAHGHEAGDQLLVTVGKRLLSLVRQSDTVARLGGDEFVLVLDNPASEAEVRGIAERVIATVSAPAMVAGHSVQVGASIGLSFFPQGGQTPAELIRQADAAMFHAKGQGKGRYHVSTSASVQAR